MITQENHHERKPDDTYKRPEHLLIGGAAQPLLGQLARGEIQTVNHHQSQPVQQRDDRQQERVGVRREPPHREMRTGEQR